MANNVLCPYCGREMEIETDSIFDVGSCGEDDFYYYECHECGAQSPCAGTKEQAYAAAIRQPLQKPLMSEEVIERRILWLETAYCEKTIKNLFPVIKTQTAMYNGTACFTTDNGRIVRFNAFDYGKEWRCWATKPSEEERRAANWDE